jgi:hypothetical protein
MIDEPYVPSVLQQVIQPSPFHDLQVQVVRSSRLKALMPSFTPPPFTRRASTASLLATNPSSTACAGKSLLTAQERGHGMWRRRAASGGPNYVG